MQIARVQRANVASRLREIADERGPFAANRARASLSALFSWALGEGIAASNPVVGTNKTTDEVSRDRVLTDAELVVIRGGVLRRRLRPHRAAAHANGATAGGSRRDD